MDKPNDFRSRWLAMPVEDRRKLATKLGHSYRYLQRLSGGFAKPSLDLAMRLGKAMPGLDLAGFDRAAKLAGRRMKR